MYSRVFISHSKDDPNLDFFHRVFSGLGTAGIWMEFEDISPPPSLEIRRRVNECSALFVLLSSPLRDLPHTRNWVSFEIGLAANWKPPFALPGARTGMDVYVFNPEYQPVDFAVPYCTYYMPYNGSTDELRFLKEMIRDAPLHNKGLPVQCPYEDCSLAFKLLSDVREYACPACGRGVAIPGGPQGSHYG